jgi:hypothetical protein
VFVVADDPVETAARWARFAALLPQAHDGGVRLETGRGRIFIGTREAVAKQLGEAPPAPAIAGYALGCGNPQAFATRCAAEELNVRHTAAGHAVSLPPALGGVWLLRA